MTHESSAKTLRPNPWDMASVLVAVVPAVFVAVMYLQSPSDPVGGDLASHAVIVRDMLETNRAFARYSQFPVGGLEAEYPALFDLTVALIVSSTGMGIIPAIYGFVIALSVLSPLCYWLLMRRFSGGKAYDAFIGVLIIAMSWFNLLKTVRDGSYGELLGAGVLLPVYACFLLGRRPLLAAGILFGITITHNLSTALALGVFAAFLVNVALRKEFAVVRRLIVAHVLTFVATAIVAWSVYESYITPIVSGTAGGFPVFGLSYYPDLLSTYLLLLGIISAALIAFTARERFFTLWTVAYGILAQTTLASGRIVRELAFPLALSIAAFTLIASGKLASQPSKRASKYAVMLMLAVLGLATANGVSNLVVSSDPSVERYLQPHQRAAYEWFNGQPMPLGAILSIDSADVYLPALVLADVYGILSEQSARTLSLPDRILNEELRNALLNFSSVSSIDSFRGRGIRWIVLSSAALSPIFTDPTELALINQVAALQLTQSPAYSLAHEETSSRGMTRIFAISTGGNP